MTTYQVQNTVSGLRTDRNRVLSYFDTDPIDESDAKTDFAKASHQICEYFSEDLTLRGL